MAGRGPGNRGGQGDSPGVRTDSRLPRR